MRVLGVDIWKGRWIVVTLQDGRFDAAVVCDDFAAVLELANDARAIAVDVPIGLVESGRRAADLAARSFLIGHRRSSVFPTAPRPALECETYEDANITCRRLTEKGLSKQSYALRAAILEVDRNATDHVFEAHPEVSFQVLAGRPLPHSKKSWGGQADRRELLASAGIEVPVDLGDANPVPPDDILDAAVCAWTARRIALGESRRLPQDIAERGRSGRLIAIHA